jgi:hypothetical protein
MKVAFVVTRLGAVRSQMSLLYAKKAFACDTKLLLALKWDKLLALQVPLGFCTNIYDLRVAIYNFVQTQTSMYTMLFLVNEKSVFALRKL